MEGGAISDAQLSASSVYYGFLGLQRWGPELARLNNHGIVNAWTSSNYDKSPWIQVSMGGVKRRSVYIWLQTMLTFLSSPGQPAEEDEAEWCYHTRCSPRGQGRVRACL